MQEERLDSFLTFIPKNKETKKDCWQPMSKEIKDKIEKMKKEEK